MSRLEFLLRDWALTLGLLRRRVRENRVGDAWRFEPLIKVYSFLINRYGSEPEPVGWLRRIVRGVVASLGILMLLGLFTAALLHWLTAGQIWDWLRDRLTE